MLEYFRTKTASTFTKIVLGAIVLSFILYFGFSGRGRYNSASMGETSPIAKVNGQNIPAGLWNRTVDNQLKFYQQVLPGKVTPEMRKGIETQVLQGLITQTLFIQNAKKLGLEITDQDLANAIRQDPNLKKDGVFQEDFYLTQFKPYYQQQFGLDFEDVLRASLLDEAYKKALAQASVSSQAQIQNMQKLNDLEIKYVKVEAPLTNPESQTQESQPQNTSQILQNWISAKKQMQTTEAILQNSSFKEETVTQSALEIFNMFNQNENLPVLECLLQAPTQKPCEKIANQGGRLIAILPLERSAKTTSTPVNLTALNQATQNQVLAGAQNLLTKNAKIEVFLKK